MVSLNGRLVFLLPAMTATSGAAIDLRGIGVAIAEKSAGIGQFLATGAGQRQKSDGVVNVVMHVPFLRRLLQEGNSMSWALQHVNTR